MQVNTKPDGTCSVQLTKTERTRLRQVRDLTAHMAKYDAELFDGYAGRAHMALYELVDQQDIATGTPDYEGKTDDPLASKDEK